MTITGRTTHIKRSNGSVHVGVNNAVRSDGSAHVQVSFIKRSNGGAWLWVFSTPDVSIDGSGGSAAEGASASGSASKNVGAVPSGVNSGNRSYAWTKNSGSEGFSVVNANSSSPTFTKNFTGVANGSTSTTGTESWRVTLTDGDTGATAVADVTIGPFSWKNTIPAYSGSTDKFISGSGTVTAPAGANSVTIYCIAIGGQGGSGYNDGLDHQYGGGGGGGGGRAVWSGAVTGGVTGFNYSVGSFGSNTTAAGLTAAPGTNGDSASGGGPGGGSLGGGASGGNVANDTGGTGSSGSGSSQGFGGAGHGAPDGTYGYGGDGTDGFGSGGSSPGGAVVFFVWSP